MLTGADERQACVVPKSSRLRESMSMIGLDYSQHI